MIRKLLFVFLVLGILTTIFLLPLFIRVKVECRSQYGECPEELNSKIASQGPKSLSQAKKEVKKTLSGNLLVSDFSMRFKLPNTLTVDIIVEKPVYSVFSRTSGKVGLVSEEGKVLSVVSESSLPQVIADADLSPGSDIGSKVLFALKLMGGVYDMYQIGKGEIQGESLVVELPHQFKVTFPLEGDWQALLGSLRLIYSKVQVSEGFEKYSQVDLRFKNPVLR